MKKHCGHCRWIDYIIPDYESNEAAGFFCNKREYRNEGEENKHLDKLNAKDNSYFLSAKKCHEPQFPQDDPDDDFEYDEEFEYLDEDFDSDRELHRD